GRARCKGIRPVSDPRSDARTPGSFEGRVPPHDLGAEEAVIALVMIDQGDADTHTPSAIERIMDLLRPEQFYSEAHRRLYEAALDLQSRGIPADAVQVASWLRERGRLE